MGIDTLLIFFQGPRIYNYCPVGDVLACSSAHKTTASVSAAREHQHTCLSLLKKHHLCCGWCDLCQVHVRLELKRGLQSSRFDNGAKWVFGRINVSKYGEKQGTEDAPQGCSMLEISIKDILWSGNPAQAEVVHCWVYERRVVCTL